MSSYKKAYTLYKRAYSWDDLKNDAGKAWNSFNDYADKNQWVRPAAYGAGGLTLGSLGFLSDKATGAATTSLGSILGVLAGLGHNKYRASEQEALAKQVAARKAAQQAARKAAQQAARKAAQQAAYKNKITHPKPDAKIKGPSYTESIDPTSVGLTTVGTGSAIYGLAKIIREKKNAASAEAGQAPNMGPTPSAGSPASSAGKPPSTADINKFMHRKGRMSNAVRKDVDALKNVKGNLLRLSPAQRNRIIKAMKRAIKR